MAVITTYLCDWCGTRSDKGMLGLFSTTQAKRGAGFLDGTFGEEWICHGCITVLHAQLQLCYEDTRSKLIIPKDGE